MLKQILYNMATLPLYISIVFMCAVAYVFYMFYKASNYHKPTLYVMLAWLVIQFFISKTGIYLDTKSLPPRFLLLVVPPLVSILLLLTLPKAKPYLAQFNLGVLSLVHAVRIPVELVLFWLFLHKGLPQLMTFEGRNFDTLAGITAPLIYYFGFYKKKLSSRFIFVWNVVSIGLLLNIVINAVLSAPFPFQQFGFEQPNVAVLYFPFIYLPGFIVPLVLFSHLISIKRR